MSNDVCYDEVGLGVAKHNWGQEAFFQNKSMD